MTSSDLKIEGDMRGVMDRIFENQNKCRDPKQMVELYNTWAETYDNDIATKFQYRFISPVKGAKALAEHVPDKNARILDCGAGTGAVGEELSKLGYNNIDALDFSEVCLEKARQKNVYKRFLCGDCLVELPKIEANTYDALICVGCFSPGHMTSAVFPDWARIVKPGGYISLILAEGYFENVPEHSGGKLMKVVTDLEREGKWKNMGQTRYDTYNHIEKVGVLMEFEAL